ncbi:MAG: DUF4097 family beta strand repeat protein [Candidatus Hydrogenedentes bacterium]|nr:DUF4097 family beta strand repeat protein [Candidatus Hydrogenedentota bacterium]
MKHLNAGLALALLLAGNATVATAQQRMTQSCDVNPEVEVYIENTSGSVTVEAWDQPKLEMNAEYENGVKELKFEVDEDSVMIDVEAPRGGGNITAHIRVRMPSQGNLTVKAVSAKVEVTGIGGDLDIETTSGKVLLAGNCRTLEVETVSGGIESQCNAETLKLEAVSGGIQNLGGADEVSLETVSGKITHVGRAGQMKAMTVSGGIDAQGAIGDLVGETVSGKVAIAGLERSISFSTVSGGMNIAANTPEDVSLETISGTITYNGSLDEDGELEVDSRSGGLNLTLPETLNATYELSTFSGSIRNDFGPRPVRAEFGPGVSLRFVMGTGSADVQAEAFSASVSLLRK